MRKDKTGKRVEINKSQSVILRKALAKSLNSDEKSLEAAQAFSECHKTLQRELNENLCNSQIISFVSFQMFESRLAFLVYFK